MPKCEAFRRKRRGPHKGGFHEDRNRWALCCIDTGGRYRQRPIRPIQRGGRHHGSLAPRVERRGGQQENLRRNGRAAGRGQCAVVAVPWHAHQPDAREYARERRQPRLGGESRGLHRQQRAGAHCAVEGGRRVGAARQQQPARPGIRGDAGRRAHRNSRRQDSVGADQTRAHSPLPA